MGDQDDDEQIESLPAPAPPDRFGDALALLAAATSPKETRKKLLRLRKLQRDVAAAEQKLAALTDQAEQKHATLAQREAQAAAREAALDAREAAFAASLQEARDNLAEYYDRLAETDRRIRRRILTPADLLAGFNERLQDLPSWQQIKQLVPGLPDDPPPIEHEFVSQPRIDVLSDRFDDPNADRQGIPFLGELTRDVSHKRRGAP